MAVMIRDEHLETLIDEERQRRGDATMAKTLSDLARERLIELQQERRPVAVDRGQAERPAESAA